MNQTASTICDGRQTQGNASILTDKSIESNRLFRTQETSEYKGTYKPILEPILM